MQGNAEISENGMISIEDIEARKWDMDFIRSALDSSDPSLSNARTLEHPIMKLEPLMVLEIESEG